MTARCRPFGRWRLTCGLRAGTFFPVRRTMKMYTHYVLIRPKGFVVRPLTDCTWTGNWPEPEAVPMSLQKAQAELEARRCNEMVYHPKSGVRFQLLDESGWSATAVLVIRRLYRLYALDPL